VYYNVHLNLIELNSMNIIDSLLRRTVRIVFLATALPIASYAAYLIANNYNEVPAETSIDLSKLAAFNKLKHEGIKE
jgi:hypothetical protein